MGKAWICSDPEAGIPGNEAKTVIWRKMKIFFIVAFRETAFGRTRGENSWTSKRLAKDSTTSSIAWDNLRGEKSLAKYYLT